MKHKDPTKLMSIGDLQRLVKTATVCVAFHAAMTLHTDFKFDKPVKNPMDDFNTGDLITMARESQNDLLRAAFIAEVDRRSQFRRSIVGWSNNQCDVTYWNHSWNHPDRPLGGDASMTATPHGLVFKLWLTNNEIKRGLGIESPTVEQSAA